MNLRDGLTQAAFWHEPYCVECQEGREEGERECGECGGRLLPAISILALVSDLEREGEGGNDGGRVEG